MTRLFLNLTGTTALAVGFCVAQAPAFAQPYDELAGLMVPSCGDGQPVDAGTLGAEAFPAAGPFVANSVQLALNTGEACLDAEGKLKFKGASAERFGIAGDTAATAESPAPAPLPLTEAITPAPEAEQPVAEAPTQPVAEAPAQPVAEAPAQPVAEAPAQPVAEAPAQPVAELPVAEAPAAEAPAEPAGEPALPQTAETLQQLLTGDTQAESDPVTENTGREQPVAEPPVSELPSQPVAAAADENGREQEAAEVSETTVTEENSRSSNEEFADQAQTATASGSGNKGLSNFEKFALGAVGIVALDAIIGKNREVVSNSGDRVVLRNQNGDLEVLRDDDTLLRRPGSEVRTETFSDGSTRTTITRQNGSKVVTIADASGRVIKRTRITADGQEFVLIDDTLESTPVDVSRLPTPAPGSRIVESGDSAALQAALRAEANFRVDRSFTLRQVRQYRQVRDLMPEISIDAINFETGSAAIQPDEAEELLDLGQALSDFIRRNPDELFLVEGHTDAVGNAASNLALSDRRAESVALALTEYFGVPPENMIIQGYGEAELLIPTPNAERANRRAVVRRVTPLLR